MSEGIGIASGIITLIAATYKTSKSLHEAVSSFHNRPREVKDVLAELDSLGIVLNTIGQQVERSGRADSFGLIRNPLDFCAAECQDMHAMLDECTSNFRDGHASVRDWIKMRYHEKSLNEMRGRLASYKSTLDIAFQAVNIQDGTATQESLRSLKDFIADKMEDLHHQLEDVKEALDTAAETSQQVLRDDLARLQGSIDNIAEAQRLANATQLSIIVEKNLAGDGSRTIFGADQQPKYHHLFVRNNEVGVGGVSSSGVFQPETLQILMQNSSTPDIALKLQALHTQSPEVQREILKSVLKSITDENRLGAANPPSASQQHIVDDNSQDEDTDMSEESEELIPKPPNREE